MNAGSRAKKQRNDWWSSPVGILVIIAAILFIIILILESRESKIIAGEPETIPQETAAPYITPETPLGRLTVFAKMHRMPVSDWPTPLIELLEKHPEAESYVLNYPFYKDVQMPIDLTSCLGADKMPLFIQWDARWGYTEYSGELFGLSACGPTSLSMVCLHLLQDAKFTPRYVADFSHENGYYTTGMGSNWTLMSEGAEKLGLEVESLYPDESLIMEELEAGNPIICIMGPGHFTSTGHFIVLAGVENGLIRVNDPNSRVRSEKLWEFSTFEDEVEGAWVFKVPQTEE